MLEERISSLCDVPLHSPVPRLFSRRCIWRAQALTPNFPAYEAFGGKSGEVEKLLYTSTVNDSVCLLSLYGVVNDIRETRNVPRQQSIRYVCISTLCTKDEKKRCNNNSRYYRALYTNKSKYKNSPCSLLCYVAAFQLYQDNVNAVRKYLYSTLIVKTFLRHKIVICTP